MLPGPYSQSTTFDDELSLRRSSLSYRFTSSNKLDSEFVSYPWLQLLFAPSFLLLDVIDERLYPHETSRQMCRDHHQHFWALPGYQEFMMRNTILAPRWFVLSLATFLLSLQHKLVHVLCCTLRSLLSNLCYVLPWSIANFYVKNVLGNSPPLRILDTSDTY